MTARHDFPDERRHGRHQHAAASCVHGKERGRRAGQYLCHPSEHLPFPAGSAVPDGQTFSIGKEVLPSAKRHIRPARIQNLPSQGGGGIHIRHALHFQEQELPLHDRCASDGQRKHVRAAPQEQVPKAAQIRRAVRPRLHLDAAPAAMCIDYAPALKVRGQGCFCHVWYAVLSLMLSVRVLPIQEQYTTSEGKFQWEITFFSCRLLFLLRNRH